MKISALIPARYDSIRFPGKLMEKQEKMMKNLESFAPLLTKAEKMIGQFSNIGGSLGNVDGLLEKLADAKPKE